MNQKVIIGGLILIIVVLGGLTFFIGKGGDIVNRLFPNPSPTPAPTSSPRNTLNPPTPTPIDGGSIIFTGLRFTPQTHEMKLGEVVNFANLGDNPIEIATNDTGTEGRKLNLGLLGAGDTSIFIEFREAGVYEYFDKFNPESTGRIIVRE